MPNYGTPAEHETVNMHDLLPDLSNPAQNLGLALLVTMALTALLAVIARADLQDLRIPDALNLTLILSGLTMSLAGPRPLDHVIGATAGYALFWVIGEIHFRRTGREGLGLGDAKLFAGAGAWLGWQGLPTVLLIAAATGLVAALLRRRTGAGTRPEGRPEIAFGPWLALGLWTVWMYAVWLPTP